MENLNKTLYVIDIKDLIHKARLKISGFAFENFIPCINWINSSYDNKTNNLLPTNILINAEIAFKDGQENCFNIVHGGSQLILFDSLINMILFYYTNNNYNTISTDISYKTKLLLNEKYIMALSIEKIQYKTVFIEGNIYLASNPKEINTTISIIKELTLKPKL